MRLASASCALLLLLAGCGGSDSGSTPAATMTLVYRASTAPDPQVVQQFPACFQMVGTTHSHPSWRAYRAVYFTANGDSEWTYTFNDVPSGKDVSLRISDGNKCSATNATGWSAENVFANGVALTPNTTLNDMGTEVPAYRFRVSPAGAVSQ